MALVILRRRRRNKATNIDYSTDAMLLKEPFIPNHGSLPFTPDLTTLVQVVTPLDSNAETTVPFSIPSMPSSPPALPQHGSALPEYAAVSRAPPIISPSLAEGSTVQLEDELGRWAEKNRPYIPHELERKLRIAHYLPSDNPDLLPANVWNDDYGVGNFELKRLQGLYARYVAVVNIDSRY